MQLFIRDIEGSKGYSFFTNEMEDVLIIAIILVPVFIPRLHKGLFVHLSPTPSVQSRLRGLIKHLHSYRDFTGKMLFQTFDDIKLHPMMSQIGVGFTYVYDTDVA